MKHIVKKIKNIITKKGNEFSGDFLKTLPYNTPFFVFSRERIKNNYNEFTKIFPNSFVHYAMKANSEPEVLETLHMAGAGFEIASKYELDMLKKINVPPAKIIYGSAVKISSHIKESYEYGVDRFAFDSLQELEKIAANAPGAKVYVRTIANDAGSVFKFSEKFGTDQSNIIPLLTQAKKLGLHPYGISFHVGSQASDPQAWANVLLGIRSILEELKSQGIILDVINLGGGYPFRYLSSETSPQLKEIGRLIMEQYKKLPYKPKLILEPGRAIIANTGVAVATVIAKIERRGSTWLFLDVGVYNGFFETMAYQGSTRYPISSLRPVGDMGKKLYAVAGPTGDSPDVITREILLPQDVEEGDKLIIHDVGAYSLSVVSAFNGFPKPKAYYI